MPGICRVGDTAHSDTDTHLVGGVPTVFPVTGTFSQGSPSYMVNSKPVVRQGDGGTHVSCIGPNAFYAVAGSDTHFVEGLPVVREGDPTYHCSDIPGAGMGQVEPFVSCNTFVD